MDEIKKRAIVGGKVILQHKVRKEEQQHPNQLDPTAKDHVFASIVDRINNANHKCVVEEEPDCSVHDKMVNGGSIDTHPGREVDFLKHIYGTQPRQAGGSHKKTGPFISCIHFAGIAERVNFRTHHNHRMKTMR